MEVLVPDHPSELGRKKVKKWLKKFIPKLKRTTSRTQKCRLIESVERVSFKNHENAYFWKYVKFEKTGIRGLWKKKGKIFNKKKKNLEEFELTGFQEILLKNQPSLNNIFIGRSEIKEETGIWQLSEDFDKNIISKGGEAIVLREKFGDLEFAVRVHVFDPFLFSEKFEKNSLTFKIHFSKGKF